MLRCLVCTERKRVLYGFHRQLGSVVEVVVGEEVEVEEVEVEGHHNRLLPLEAAVEGNHQHTFHSAKSTLRYTTMLRCLVGTARKRVLYGLHRRLSLS
jgi:hypothetical protein